MKADHKLKLAEAEKKLREKQANERKARQEKAQATQANQTQAILDELKIHVGEILSSYTDQAGAVVSALSSLDLKTEVTGIEELKDLLDRIEKKLPDHIEPPIVNVPPAKITLKSQEVTIPKGLATDATLKGVLNQIKGLEEKLKPSQKPENFIPFRRVRKEGQRLIFDDSYWQSSSGGGGSSSSSTTTSATGSLKYGLNASIAITVTDTVVSYTAASGEKLRGFVATSNRSGLFRLKINGTAKLSGRVAPGTETVNVFMPIPQSLSAGDTVLVEVTNEGQGTGSFEGSILIEE